jgi:hypothetical protein
VCALGTGQMSGNCLKISIPGMPHVGKNRAQRAAPLHEEWPRSQFRDSLHRSAPTDAAVLPLKIEFVSSVRRRIGIRGYPRHDSSSVSFPGSSLGIRFVRALPGHSAAPFHAPEGGGASRHASPDGALELAYRASRSTPIRSAASVPWFSQ